MAKKAAVAELPEYTEPSATVGDEAAPTVEVPEFEVVSMQSKLQFMSFQNSQAE